MNRKVYSDSSIKRIREHLESRDSKYITYPKFFFLCGKGFDKEDKNSYHCSNRGILQDFIEKLLPDAKIVLSEQLWEDDFDKSIDLLVFEQFLAEVSDAVILFVESPGAFCELGAFAYADASFSDKLIIIMDEQYRDSHSFISTGPVLKAKSDGSKVFYASIKDGSIMASHELRSGIISFVNDLKTRQSKMNKRIVNKGTCVYINSFINEILELLKLVQPILTKDLIPLYKLIKGFESFTLVDRTGNEFKREIRIKYIMKLLQKAGIIQVNGEGDNEIVFLSDYRKVQNLMLKYYGNGMYRERNRLLCRSIAMVNAYDISC